MASDAVTSAKVADAFYAAEPFHEIVLTGYRQYNQPDKIASQAYEAIQETRLRPKQEIDYKMASAINEPFDELFQHEADRTR
jgi:hypothetical protein